MENVQENSAGINDDVSLFSQILKSWDRVIRKVQIQFSQSISELDS